MRPYEKNVIYGGYVYTYFFSNLVINKLAYEDANLVPIAAPDTWW